MRGGRSTTQNWLLRICRSSSTWRMTTSITKNSMARTHEPRAASRGDVWFAEVPGDKRRPVLVLSRDPMGRLLHSVICAPITSNIRGLATEVSLGQEAGLAHASAANFDNTFLLARTR